MSDERVRLDLNNPVFQRTLFRLVKSDQLSVLGTLRKLSELTWNQVYRDPGLKWELIYSRQGPHGERLYSFPIGRDFRAVAYRDGPWLRLLSLHPDHDSAYR
ncbi:hypothetical protein [Kyrpidia tusciae]|uniref:Uncharacterized protein n=1 Tax=Kyrpidia tusciae (strain DSM 2912 / NBRC 15312 / T2) TaxID=562970 RepID=D5WY16_KYRT2|nr:hypothetical protein [Kyrpidia tusciae]ADG06075.1 conserved hypothetical protein [Kyrpidia tusciae DSM 2912]